MDAAVELAQPGRENEKLRTDVVDLKRQLDWFRRQLFGSKSEKRVEIPPEQMTFRDQLGMEHPAKPEEPEFEFAERKKKKRGKKDFEGAADESGLRFGPDVPAGTIRPDNPEADAIPESERELVGEKTARKLAQSTSTFKILRCVQRTWKRRDTGKLVASAAPPAVLDRACADAGFLAGMMVDKFCWHLPPRRQHRRLEAAGIRAGRSSPANWMPGSASLLAPVRDAQFRSILESKAVAMDETPIRAGRTGPGQMRTAWFWPIFGDRGEIDFPFRLSRENDAVPDLLGDFEGTLLSDGNQAYAAYADSRNGAAGAHPAGPTPGENSRRRRIPSRGSPPRPWIRSGRCTCAKRRSG